MTRLIGFPRRCAADNAETQWLLRAEECDVIALGMLALLRLPIDARTHAPASGLWRRFEGGECPAVRPEGEWR